MKIDFRLINEFISHIDNVIVMTQRNTESLKAEEKKLSTCTPKSLSAIGGSSSTNIIGHIAACILMSSTDMMGMDISHLFLPSLI